MKIFIKSAAWTLAFLATLHSQAAESENCTTLRVADIGWTDNAANNGVATAVLQGLGYSVVKTTVSAPIAITGLKNGQLDMFLDYWSPSLDSTISPFKSDVFIVPEPNMEGAKYTLAVPKYLYDAGLKDFSDIAKFKDELGEKIYGIEPGSGGNRLVTQMIDKNQFGLGSFKLIASSEAAMLVQVQKAISRKAPVVFLGWSPHPMNLRIEMTYLTGGDAVFGPNFGSAKVYTVISKKFNSECLNASKLIKQLKFTPEMESALMQKIMEREDPTMSAKTYLRANPDLLQAWLSGITTVDGKDGLSAVRRSINN
jgi:glycine betaine/proline transport system substrate-binding protein